MDADMESLVRSLNEKLQEARDAYYKAAAPIMSDAEYDTLEAQLKAAVDANPSLAPLATVLATVGNDVVNGNRVRHIRPMLSIENKYEKSEIVDFFRSLPPGSAMLLEPKRDGISCELRYRGGLLVKALTRGSGSEGEDMTAQVMQVATIPKQIPEGKEHFKDFNIRGELVMRKSELDRLNKEAAAAGAKTYASTRNLTAGTMKLKDVSEVAKREILFMPWEMYDAEGLPDSAYQRMLIAQSLGFQKYEGFLIDSEEAVLRVLDHVLKANEQSDVIADGVVAKADSHKVRDQIGNGSKFHKYQVCFKPQSASGTTYLRSITWQVGRQGKLTPVAECDPVPLAGAMVVRATLNNITWIETMGLKLGAKVEMLRSGDVIPQIVRVIDEGTVPIVAPTICPECGSKLEILNEGATGIVTQWCENLECPGRVCDLFTYIASRDILEIDGLGPDMAERLIRKDEGGQVYARDLGELFQFQADALTALKQLQEKMGEEGGETAFEARMAKKGFSGAAMLKMVKSMEKAKTAEWTRWLAAMGIPMIGRTLGKTLAKVFQLGSDDISALPDKLSQIATTQIEGIGPEKRAMILEWASDPRSKRICGDLEAAGVRPKPLVVPSGIDAAGAPLKGISFCITGECDEDRDSVAAKLERLGAIKKSGVSKNLTHLIVLEAPGKSKLDKARQLGTVQIVDKQWLIEALAKGGLTLAGAKFEVEEV